MIKQFLVASADEPVSDWEPVIVSANDSDDAIDRYLRIEYSKQPFFREGVLEIDGAFVERFFVETPAEIHSFETTGRIEYDMETVKSRIRVFFSGRPDLGDRFVRFIDTRCESHLNDEVFEFIAASDADGITALDLDRIRRI